MRDFIIGTDWWTDCDDVVAMRIIARAANQKSISVKGICINACMDYSAASLGSFLATEGIFNMPIALDKTAVDFGGNPPYQKRLAALADKFNAQNKNIVNNSTAKEPVRFYRELLAKADLPLEIIEIGYLQVIAAVLKSRGDDISEKSGTQLFCEKVSKMWVMAGKWDKSGETENNFCRNERSRTAAAEFCRLCPVPVTFLGFETGKDVITGNLLCETDVLYQALCDHGSKKGRSSWDPMLVLTAVIGDEAKAGYGCVFGTASVDAKTGQNYFEEAANGLHRYVVKNLMILFMPI